ncbi:flavodoxin family protein [Chloroflexota bacterium]
MKVLGIVCSPQKNGNTEIMMKEALAGASSCGAESELWTVAGKELKPCDACSSCNKTGKCHINDDMQELYPKVLAADGLIFGSPAYFRSLTAQAKMVVDRLYCLYYQDVLPDKVAGVISIATAHGHDGVWAPFRQFFELCHMFPADCIWGFAQRKGDIRKDRFGMKASEELGKQVVSLIKQKLHLPKEYRRHVYRICDETHGISHYPLQDLVSR